jgi:16S rRNA G966 N2-methylase RsmD
MKMTQYLNWKADPSKGEVFTPIELVKEMLDKIPEDVWKNPKSIFLDPCMGKGTFLIEIVNRLTYIYGYTEENAKSRVYGYDIRVKYINYLQRRGFVNLRHKDFLSEIIKMKFDVIVGNPPYNDNGGIKKGGKNLYSKFISLSLKLLKDDGYFSFVTNAGFLKSTTGDRNEILNEFLSNNLIYLNVHECKKWFKNVGGAMIFCYFLFQKNQNYKGTKCVSQLSLDSQVYEDFVDLRNLQWIPRIVTKDVISLIGKFENPSYNFQRIDEIENSNIDLTDMVGFKRLNHLVKPYSVMASENLQKGTFIVINSTQKNEDIEFLNSSLFSFLNVIHRYDGIVYHKMISKFGKPKVPISEDEINFINNLLN